MPWTGQIGVVPLYQYKVGSVGDRMQEMVCCGQLRPPPARNDLGVRRKSSEKTEV